MTHYLWIFPPSSLAIFNPRSLQNCPYRIICRTKRLENVISHRGSACMKVQKKSFLVGKKEELANRNLLRKGEGHVFFLCVSDTYSFSRVAVVVFCMST